MVVRRPELTDDEVMALWRAEDEAGRHDSTIARLCRDLHRARGDRAFYMERATTAAKKLDPHGDWFSLERAVEA